MKNYIIRIDQTDGFYYYHPYGKGRIWKEAYRMTEKEAIDRVIRLKLEMKINTIEIIEVT